MGITSQYQLLYRMGQSYASISLDDTKNFAMLVPSLMIELRKTIAIAIAVSMLLFSIAHQLGQEKKLVSVPRGDVGAIDIDDLRSKWQENVFRILAEYDQNLQAQTTRDALLDLQVPADAQDIHLGLVLAFQAASDTRVNSSVTVENARAAFIKYTTTHP